MRRLAWASLVVLLAAAVHAHAGQYTCANGARPLAGNRCPDGGMALYRADEVKPHRAGGVGAQGARPVTPHQSQEVKPFTQDDLRRMRENDRKAGTDLARKIAPNGTLNQRQLDALNTQRCLSAAAVNPDVRCVQR